MSDDLLTPEELQRRIYTVRGLQVMLDEDLASLYAVETRVLNQAVKRNLERFPPEFLFQLTEPEKEILRSQSVTSSWGGRRTLPFAFTEMGVAMLSAVLRSETAVRVSIQIMQAFVSMRRFLQTNAQVFQRLESLELKQFRTDQKIETVLAAIEGKAHLPKQGIFFDGQVFDAWQFVSDLIRSARTSLVLIDSYVDDTTLSLFSKRSPDVSVLVLTRMSPPLAKDLEKFNAQYPPVSAREFHLSHDRFLILDDRDVYHMGASLKDVGKRWFAFSKLELGSLRVIEAVKSARG